MKARDDRPTYGYLLIVEDDRFGFIGGLLTICDRGRPLEFHCTEPVRPSRAEQVLFGPTLRAHIHGDQLGAALISKAKLPIGLLLTLDQETAGAAEATSTPSLTLTEGADPPAELERLADSIDPLEPFQRVREAILEAQRLVVDATSASGGEAHAAA